MVLEGRITKEEFNDLVLTLIEKSQQLHDEWERIEHVCGDKVVYYLCKRNYYRLVNPTRVSSNNNAILDDDTDDDEANDILQNCSTIEPEDNNCCNSLPQAPNSQNHQQVYHVYEYHIVYSPAYSVPVLYFDPKTTDGRRLALEEIWNTVNLEYAQSVKYDAWSFISQQEHPLLGRVFYFIHPCHTSNFMQIITGKGSNEKLYLCTWLSAVGPVIGLQLSPSYFL
ncbi:uncharacterized protein TRIADDRAFT_57861 [Trichoplax adhaerens]|uniref:Ubiquitin-like-conjugating enzyme ATG10 n=1 Tax=Trichoplax adhaerens TaxID=10228 RepID=B3S1R8_TRIAD|nr:hypothetical protein TRIADDRAFT_57861 [Trichoplax adhaerens]EDV23020.1 hypothetical protein TRIADDRAFT_57861 [Trichoplax adhaerens]|eukprot:XP_002113930.1 hypothetical protein TRIADDRAFT_57861 [Trichoplax adhaerens]